MWLRHKRTGEIVELVGIAPDDKDEVAIEYSDGRTGEPIRSLAELNEEWEDYEEPEQYWFIDDEGDITNISLLPNDNCWRAIFDLRRLAIGNYFETKEEAERAVEKLKAWKRLKDRGFEFAHCSSIDGEEETLQILAHLPEDIAPADYMLLFGGEDE